MSFGLGLGLTLGGTSGGSKFPASGPSLDLVFGGASTSGSVGANSSLDLNFTGDSYTVGAPYAVWTGSRMQVREFQDIVTFSRATGNATYYNSSGYLTTAGVWNYLTYSNVFDNAAWSKSNSFIQSNLLTYSEQFDNAAWFTNTGSITVTPNSSGTLAPDGTQTADLLTEGAGARSRFGIYYTLTPVLINSTYTCSVHIKQNAGSRFVRLALNTSTSNVFACVDINPSTGVITQTLTQGAVTNVSSSVTSVGNGWYRVSITGTQAFNYLTVIFVTSSTTPSGIDFGYEAYTGSTSNSVYIWGAQLVQGSVPGDYRATTSAALPCLYADYNGALRARKLCEDAANSQHYWSIPTAVTAGFPYTISFRAKAAEKTQIVYTWSTAGATFNTGAATFNLSAGTITPSGAATGTITALGNGWYLCTTTNTCVTTTALSAHYWSFTGLTTYTGDGSSGIYIADAQLNDGSSALSYYNTTQYPYYAPRFSYDPVTLQPDGLLIEEQRTNLLTYSNDFSNAIWVAASGTKIVASTVGSPEGNVNAWILTDSSAVAFDGIHQPVTIPVDSATYTGSVYIRKTTGGTSPTFGINMLINGGTSVNNNVRINTDLGTVLAGTATVTNVGSWWRVACPITNNGTAGNTTLSMQLFAATNTYNLGASVASATGSATIYGAQLEAGTFASTYIPTLGSQLTRAVESASVNTLTPWFNASAGTLYVEFDTYGYNPLYYPCAAQIGVAGIGSRGYIHVINGPTATTSFNVFDDALVYQGPTNSVAYTVGAFRKQVGTYRVNDIAGTSDGVAVVTDTTATLPTNLNVLTIGGYANVGTTNQVNGHIRRITYYPRRLPNTDLQTLTTL